MFDLGTNAASAHKMLIRPDSVFFSPPSDLYLAQQGRVIWLIEVFLLQSCVSTEIIGLLYGASGAEFTSFPLSIAADSPGMFAQAHPTECLLHRKLAARPKMERS